MYPTTSPTRPVTTIRPRPAAPQPQWQGLFREPVYADGLPYETAAGGPLEDQDDDQGPVFITA